MKGLAKKIISACLSLSFIFSMAAFAACDNKGTENDPSNQDPVGGNEVVSNQWKDYDATRLYMLSDWHSLMESFVFRTKTGKLIVIDGGIDGVGYDRAPYLPSALRAIAGVGEGEYFEVEAWFLSHAHKDHFFELSKMLNAYTKQSNYKINHFYFDYPDFTSASYPSDTNDRAHLESLKNGFDRYAKVNGIAVPKNSTYYEEVNGAVINAAAIEKGLDINIDEIRFEILQTFLPNAGSVINNNSLVMRAWVEGQSVLFVNDLENVGGAKLLETYGSKLKSDIVQMGHHGVGVRCVEQPVYDAIDAKVHLWCSPNFVWTEPQTYLTDVSRKMVNGGVDFTEPNEYNIVACRYKAYPTDLTSVSSWAEVVTGMSFTLPYSAIKND